MSIRLSGVVSGMDTESMVKELMSAHRLKVTKIENKKTTAEWKQEIWKSLNSKLYSFYTGSLSKMKLQSSFNTRKASTSDESKATVTAGNNAPDGTHTLKISQLASSQNVTGEALASGVNGSTTLTSMGYAAGDTITVKVGTKETVLEITDETTINDMVAKLKSAGLNASFDTNQKRFFISSKNSGSANAFSLDSSNTTALANLGLNTISIDGTTGQPKASSTGTAKMTLLEPKDAKFVYNGAEMTSSTNTVSVNGLTITLKSVTNGSNTATEDDDEVININITNDVDAVYNMVKSFVKEYNELLKQMNTYYNATSAKGYDPLTDEQKETMTDSQIEKWETKIKDALLRRDENLASLINTMRTSLSGTVKIDGKGYSLATFGINSLNYSENGILHINGDKDDSLVSGSEDLLRKALEEEPDKVMEVLNKLAGDLYSSFTESMKSSTLRSALTLYNDKQLSNQIKDYEKDVAALEKKLKTMEDKYYKQFSAMESAMAKLNSQSSSLNSMLGIS